MNNKEAHSLCLRKARQIIRQKTSIRQTYVVVAIGMSKKGDIVAVKTNMASGRYKCLRMHAEGRMMLRYGNRISKILIARFGRDGQQKPIDPCDMCKSYAQSHGILIESLGC